MAVEFTPCRELRGVAFDRAWNAIRHSSCDKARTRLSMEDFRMIFDQVVPVVALTVADELRSRAQTESDHANHYDKDDWNRTVYNNRAFGLHGAELAVRDAFDAKPVSK